MFFNHFLHTVWNAGHAPANLAFAAVLTSSYASLAFSKYRRAQIAPYSALYVETA